jgi:hypothetical protein
MKIHSIDRQFPESRAAPCWEVRVQYWFLRLGEEKGNEKNRDRVLGANNRNGIIYRASCEVSLGEGKRT